MKYEDGFLILTDAEVELLACTARANVEPGYEANYYFTTLAEMKAGATVYLNDVSVKGDIWRMYPN